jgi:lipopolysaccharide/colanic/teichoic acid biosynthesis glycosyltransferase
MSSFTRRLIDILASALGLILLSPVLFFIMALLKRENPVEGVFYCGPRLGRGGRPFAMLKFRTMQENGTTTARITASDDERITPLGRWLRDSKLNELPQLWNVLIGDMSLVGPRPEDPEIASHWTASIREVILSVRPGITSPASVIYRNEEKLLNGDNFMDDYLNEVLPDKLRLDYLYVRNRTLLTDLDILFLTLVALFPLIKKTPLPEKMLFWGPFSRFANRYFSWFIADNLVAFAAVGLSGMIRRISGPLDLGLLDSLFIAIGMAFVFSLINWSLGLGNLAWSQAQPAYALELAFSTGIATGLIFLVNWFWPGGSLLPRGLVINIGTLAFFGFVAVRYRERLITGLASRWIYHRDRTHALGVGERVLIVGAGDCGQLAAWLLLKSKFSTPYTIVGMVDDDHRKQGQTIDSFHVLGQSRDIPQLVQSHDIGLIMFAITKLLPEERKRILDLCRQTSAHVVIIPDLLDYFQKQLAHQV